MNTTRIFTAAVSLILTAASAGAQEFTLAPAIQIGAGWVKSKNLQKNFDLRNAQDADIITWEVHNKPGLAIGIGGRAEYSPNDNWAVAGELTYNLFLCSINIDYSKDKLDKNGNGDRTNINSEAKFKFTSFQIPFLVNYKFSGAHGFYAAGGLNFIFAASPWIDSYEVKTRENFNNGVGVSNTVEIKSVKAQLDEFSSPRAGLILAAGMQFKAGNSDFNVELRYQPPGSASAMFTRSGGFDDNTFKNNEVFGLPGKNDAEAAAPQFPLIDFRTQAISFVLAFSIFKK